MLNFSTPHKCVQCFTRPGWRSQLTNQCANCEVNLLNPANCLPFCNWCLLAKLKMLTMRCSTDSSSFLWSNAKQVSCNFELPVCLDMWNCLLVDNALKSRVADYVIFLSHILWHNLLGYGQTLKTVTKMCQLNISWIFLKHHWVCHLNVVEWPWLGSLP